MLLIYQREAAVNQRTREELPRQQGGKTKIAYGGILLGSPPKLRSQVEPRAEDE